ncbi:nitroreductase family protein [Thermodesulfobacteriota bacterium]
MDDFIGIVRGRRSIRRYREKEIPEQFINQILESVQWCPSWSNTQCWEIIVVRTPAQKERLHGLLNDTNPSKKAIIQAPVVIAICGKTKSAGYFKGKALTKFKDWFMFDLGIATQTLCLTACSLGLGTVIVGMFDHGKAKEVLKVGEEYEVIALIPMGYPAKDSRAPKRREINEFMHNETF